jgi:hypothetical protein
VRGAESLYPFAVNIYFPLPSHAVCWVKHHPAASWQAFGKILSDASPATPAGCGEDDNGF